VDVLHVSPAGPVVCVRPCRASAHYGLVSFDTNRMIRETFDAAGFPAPIPRDVVQGDPTGAAGGLSALARPVAVRPCPAGAAMRGTAGMFANGRSVVVSPATGP
jgi:hypothetical protein